VSSTLPQARSFAQTFAINVDQDDSPVTGPTARKDKRPIELVDGDEGAATSKSLKRSATDSAPESSKAIKATSTAVQGSRTTRKGKARDLGNDDGNDEDPAPKPKKRAKSMAQLAPAQTTAPSTDTSPVESRTDEPAAPAKRQRSRANTIRSRRTTAEALATDAPTDAESTTPVPRKRAPSRTPKTKKAAAKSKSAQVEGEESGPVIPAWFAEKKLAPLAFEFGFPVMTRIVERALDGTFGAT
jgi:hypothetical protein